MRCSTRTVLRLIETGELSSVSKLPGRVGAYLLDRADVERVAKIRAEAERLSEAQTKARVKARAEARAKSRRAKAQLDEADQLPIPTPGAGQTRSEPKTHAA